MALERVSATAVMIAAALAAALLFQIDWLFFLAIALTAVVLFTNKSATRAKHKHEKTEEKTEKKVKRRVVVVRQPVHHQPSDILQEKIQDEIKEVPLLKPYSHIHDKWGGGSSWPKHGH